MSLFGNRNIAIHIGTFLDYGSITSMKVVSRVAREVSVPLMTGHMLAIGLKTEEEQKLAYRCIICERKTEQPDVRMDTDKKYSVCGACRPHSAAKCRCCGAMRLKNFMVSDGYNHACKDCGKTNKKMSPVTDVVGLQAFRQWVNSEIIKLQRLSGGRTIALFSQYGPPIRDCTSCRRMRPTQDLISYPICPLKNKFGAFCANQSSCKPFYPVPKSWQVPYIYDKSW